jgi:hypothetical protein
VVESSVVARSSLAGDVHAPVGNFPMFFFKYVKVSELTNSCPRLGAPARP